MSRYDDIIDLPHHVSDHRKRMTPEERAAQFSPFQALTGFGESIGERERLTERRPELSDTEKEDLDLKMAILKETVPGAVKVSVVWFRNDMKKAGGSFQTYTGGIKKIDEFERVIVTEDLSVIRLDDVISVDSELFAALEEY